MIENPPKGGALLEPATQDQVMLNAQHAEMKSLNQEVQQHQLNQQLGDTKIESSEIMKPLPAT